MSATLLLEKLRTLGREREALVAVLSGTPEGLFVYYVCPLSNLRQIAQSGIRPYARAPRNRTDLSGQNVQARREINVLLTGGIQVKLHDCVNLFWNPINLTFRAFQRNGLLREATSKNPDDAIICILEVDLERLLLEPTCKWTIAPQNFAAC